MSPQNRLVFRFMFDHPADGITPVTALRHCGSFRLSERIRELQAEGHKIEKAWHTTKKGARVRRYFLTNTKWESKKFRKICRGKR
jgi:hypothetical protein